MQSVYRSNTNRLTHQPYIGDSVWKKTVRFHPYPNSTYTIRGLALLSGLWRRTTHLTWITGVFRSGDLHQRPDASENKSLVGYPRQDALYERSTLDVRLFNICSLENRNKRKIEHFAFVKLAKPNGLKRVKQMYRHFVSEFDTWQRIARSCAGVSKTGFNQTTV